MITNPEKQSVSNSLTAHLHLSSNSAQNGLVEFITGVYIQTAFVIKLNALQEKYSEQTKHAV